VTVTLTEAWLLPGLASPIVDTLALKASIPVTAGITTTVTETLPPLPIVGKVQMMVVGGLKKHEPGGVTDMNVTRLAARAPG
jgi:hypothetical protein